ncbi:hypothetical protein LCGC14_0205080 [marine sediment metagenome]|uniref:Uncharacterized protein n=1 Tax=marine sediment metagenome TaxID=412755 RepID=A0A0F9UHT4_9ZZZZ|nr:hypothetical protein [Phycisphaerae bacterium]HDZ43316.1 hypothetical protein [Phycisphaerae bacterium]
MSSIPQDPIEAFWSGLAAAWTIVLGPISAMIAGTAVGLVAGGAWYMLTDPLGLPTLGAVVLPVTMLASLGGQVRMLVVIGGTLTFWFSSRWRLEGWWIVCTAAAIQAFAFFPGVFGFWRVVGGVVGAGLLIALYVASKRYPAWRYERALRKPRKPKPRSPAKR